MENVSRRPGHEVGVTREGEVLLSAQAEQVAGHQCVGAALNPHLDRGLARDARLELQEALVDGAELLDVQLAERPEGCGERLTVGILEAAGDVEFQAGAPRPIARTAEETQARSGNEKPVTDRPARQAVPEECGPATAAPRGGHIRVLVPAADVREAEGRSPGRL